MRILVVDDDALAAEMTSAVLEDGGCDVVAVESADLALARLAEDPFSKKGLSDFELIETVARKTDPRLEFLQG